MDGIDQLHFSHVDAIVIWLQNTFELETFTNIQFIVTIDAILINIFRFRTFKNAFIIIVHRLYIYIQRR